MTKNDSKKDPKLKWNTGGWFIGNIFGIIFFGKMSYLAAQEGAYLGSVLIGVFTLTQIGTVVYPWLKRKTFPPGKAAIIHVVGVMGAGIVTLGYVHWAELKLDPESHTNLARLPWVVGVILILLLAVIGYAARAEAAEARKAAEEESDASQTPATTSQA